VFDEHVTLLQSLAIPDVGAFIISFLSMRCMPLGMRKLFESSFTDEFPSVKVVVTFIKERVRIFENAGVSSVIDSHQRRVDSKPSLQFNTNFKR